MLKIKTAPDNFRKNSDFIRIAKLKTLKGVYELPRLIPVIQKEKLLLKGPCRLPLYVLTFQSIFYFLKN